MPEGEGYRTDGEEWDQSWSCICPRANYVKDIWDAKLLIVNRMTREIK